MWTVIVGRNGLCKTSILRMIALAASGRDRANQLAQDLISSLRDARQPEVPSIVRAEFGFGELGDQRGREYPGLDSPIADQRVHAKLELVADRQLFQGSSWYQHQRDASSGSVQSTFNMDSSLLDGPDVLSSFSNPFEEARAKGLPHWFVAGYGVRRSLPKPARPAAPKIWSARTSSPCSIAASSSARASPISSTASRP